MLYLRLVFISMLAMLVLTGCTTSKNKAGEDIKIEKSNDSVGNNKTSIKGVYYESKMGPIVNGVLLDTDYNQSYEGKTVEVTGEVYEDSSLSVKPYVKGQNAEQGYQGAIQRMRVASIKVI